MANMTFGVNIIPKDNTVSLGTSQNKWKINGVDDPKLTDTTYSEATTSTAGLMSATDKSKLDGIAAGAQVNSVTGVKGNAESSYRTGNVNLTYANVGAPSTTGTGASGTWDIGITGNAATATKATQDSNGNIINSTYLKLSGGTMSGNLLIQKSGGSNIQVGNTDTGTHCLLTVETGGQHGIYSSGYWDGSSYVVDGEWLIYRAQGGNITVNGDCTGNAATASSSPKLTLQTKNIQSTKTNAYATEGLNIRWFDQANKLPGQPSTHGFLLTAATADGAGENHQIFMEQANGQLYHRGTNTSSAPEPPAFKTILDSSNYTNYTVNKTGLGASGTWGISISDNAATATKATQDGDGNIISSTYLKLSGGTLNGNLTISHATNDTMTADSTNPKITFSESGNQPVHLIYTDYDNYRSPAGLKIVGGTSANPAWFEVEGQVYAAGFNGPLTGNAATATKLATARNINGTSFDGSAAITTANWGTARNITIKDASSTNAGTAVSVNGSANVTLLLPSTIKASITGNCSGNAANVTGTVAISHGGTGSTTKAGARTALGIHTKDVMISVGGTEKDTGLAVSSYEVISLTQTNPYSAVCTIKGAHPDSSTNTWKIVCDAVQVSTAAVRILYIDK